MAPRSWLRSPGDAPRRRRRLATGPADRRRARIDGQIRVRHRAAKRGLGRAYLDGFSVAHAGGATRVVRWTPTDRTTRRSCRPSWLIEETGHLVIGSRAARGGGRRRGRPARHLARRGLFTLIVLGLRPARPHRRLQGLARGRPSPGSPDGIHAGNYVFRSNDLPGVASHARPGVPITFRDRRVGQSDDRQIVEALVVVVQLRAEELWSRIRRRPVASETPSAT